MVLRKTTAVYPAGTLRKLAELKGYFKAMMWYGRQTFRLKNEDETKSAVLIALRSAKTTTPLSWDKIYEPTSFLWVRAMTSLICSSKNNWIKFMALRQTSPHCGRPKQMDCLPENIQTLEPPAVNSIPIFDKLSSPTGKKKLRAFALWAALPPLDAAIFQRLVYREVKENNQANEGCYPRGSTSQPPLGPGSIQHLDELRETDYELYRENMAKLQKHRPT